MKNAVPFSRNTEIEIPIEGCLAILAEGSRGIRAWKKKKSQSKNTGKLKDAGEE